MKFLRKFKGCTRVNGQRNKEIRHVLNVEK